MTADDAPTPGVCRHCGAQTPMGPRGYLLFCRATDGKRYSPCFKRYWDIKRRGAKNAARRIRFKALKNDPIRYDRLKRDKNARARAVRADPVRGEDKRRKEREYYAHRKATVPDFMERERERWRRRARVAVVRLRKPRRAIKVKTVGLLAGSVIAAASHRSPGREILDAILPLISGKFDRGTAQEVVSEAAILMIEGADAAAAVKAATTAVFREAAPYRNAKKIDDCYWL